jgi:hypothetical protein
MPASAKRTRKRATEMLLQLVGALVASAIFAIPAGAATPTTTGSADTSTTMDRSLVNGNAPYSGSCNIETSGNWTYDEPSGPTDWSIKPTASCSQKALVDTTTGLLYNLKGATICYSAENYWIAGKVADSGCTLVYPGGAGVWTVFSTTYITAGGLGTEVKLGEYVFPGAARVNVLTPNQVVVTVDANATVP